MRLQTESKFTARDIALLSVLLAAVLIMGLVEGMIPFDFAVPGVKLGLSNIVILIAIYLFAFPRTFILVLLKCITLALLTGNVFSFLYSLSGSVLSFLVMWLMIYLFGNSDKISPIGVSVTGAVFHNLGQILAASFVLGTFNVVAYLPVLIVSGVITGVIIGTAVKHTLPYVKSYTNQ